MRKSKGGSEDFCGKTLGKSTKVLPEFLDGRVFGVFLYEVRPVVRGIRLTFPVPHCRISLILQAVRRHGAALSSADDGKRGAVGMTDRQKGIFLAILCPCLWGIMGIFVRKITSTGIGVVDVSFFRCAASGLLLLLFYAVTKPGVLKVGWKGRLISACYGMVAYSLSFVAYSISVSRIPVAVAMILMFLCPVWVTLFSVLLFHDRVDRQKILAILVCLCGAALAADLLSVGEVRLDGIGMLMGIFNGMGAALQIVVPRYFSDRYSKDTMVVYGFLGAALALLFFVNVEEIATAFQTSNVMQLGASIFVVSVLCTMVANVAFVKSTEYIDGTETSILSALEVVVGSLAGFLVYHEALEPLQVVGMVLVIAGSLSTEISWKSLLRRGKEPH